MGRRSHAHINPAGISLALGVSRAVFLSGLILVRDRKLSTIHNNKQKIRKKEKKYRKSKSVSKNLRNVFCCHAYFYMILIFITAFIHFEMENLVFPTLFHMKAMRFVAKNRHCGFLWIAFIRPHTSAVLSNHHFPCFECRLDDESCAPLEVGYLKARRPALCFQTLLCLISMRNLLRDAGRRG